MLEVVSLFHWFSNLSSGSPVQYQWPDKRLFNFSHLLRVRLKNCYVIELESLSNCYPLTKLLKTVPNYWQKVDIWQSNLILTILPKYKIAARRDTV